MYTVCIVGVPEPEDIHVKMDQNPVLVTWKKPGRLDRIKGTYVLSLWKKGKEGEGEEHLQNIPSTSEEWCAADFKFNMAYLYIIRVSIMLENGYQGKVATCCTGTGKVNFDSYVRMK